MSRTGPTFTGLTGLPPRCGSSDGDAGQSLVVSNATSVPSTALSSNGGSQLNDPEESHFGDRQNSFFMASANGTLDQVCQEVQSNPSMIWAEDKDGQTGLLIAAGAGHFDVVRYLHSCGANVNHKDRTGATPLYRASAKNHLAIMKFLAQCGADIEEPCINGFTPLIVASLASHIEVIKFLQSLRANMETAEMNGLTPFLVSCAGCADVEVVRYLKEECGCDHEKVENNGCTALILSAGAGNLEVCQYLLDSGVDIDAQSNGGFTATFSACSSGNLDVVKFLYERGADVEKRSNKGSSPLYIAAVHGHLDVVHYLHSVGADIESTDNNGLTPLHASVGAGSSSIRVFAYLINCGCDITRIDVHDRKPLDYARRDPLHMLISIIASLWHESPFHKACYENDVESLRVLLDEEGRACTQFFTLDCVGKDAWTPLHVAAFFNRVEAAELLLQAGANISALSFGKQQTALMIACQKGHTQIVRLILKYSNSWRCSREDKRDSKRVCRR